MKTVGFIDYYLSEWHANHYPDWIREAGEAIGEEIRLTHAWGELPVSPVDGKTNAAWCRERGALLCETPEEVCRAVDYPIILAPSNPERHLDYARAVLPFRKPTFIDKTFAENRASAEEINRIARENGTPFFSTSALRYATELSEVPDCRRIYVLGGGSNAPEYLVHQIEMVVASIGVGAQTVTAIPHGAECTFFIRYADDRAATLFYALNAPNAAYMASRSGAESFITVHSHIFGGLMNDMLRFFATGTPSFPVEQTLEAMAIREAALVAMAKPGTAIPLPR